MILTVPCTTTLSQVLYVSLYYVPEQHPFTDVVPEKLMLLVIMLFDMVSEIIVLLFKNNVPISYTYRRTRGLVNISFGRFARPKYINAYYNGK